MYRYVLKNYHIEIFGVKIVLDLLSIEVKSVWSIPTKKEGLYKRDEDRISGDYEKLRDFYTKFDSKIMLVTFLGYPNKYRRNTFKQFVELLVHKNSSIIVITC